MINNENFEIYLIDYLDDSLSDEKKKEVENFLILNPHIKERIDGMKDTILTPPVISFPYKNKLKKLSVTPHYSDGKNSEILHSMVEELETLEKDFKLKPDYSIVYPGKAKLYKSPQIKGFWKNIIAIASIILLLVTVSFTIFFNKNLTVANEQIYIARESIMELTTEPYIILLENSDPFASSSLIIEEKNQYLYTLEPLNINILSSYLPNENLPLLEYELPIVDLIIKDEIILTSQAQEWKPSGEVFSSKNLFNSIYEAGKNLTELMKNQE